MASCKIVYQNVNAAVETIGSTSTTLKTAGETFVSSFFSAIAPMQGAAKDALEKFFKDQMEPLVTESVPGAVEGMQKLLAANLENFTTVDQNLADSISGGGQ
jgi:hypothetical protein